MTDATEEVKAFMLEELKGSTSHGGATYISYLLRMWAISRSGEGGEEKWLASVQSPLTQEQRHFTDLESLFAYLRKMTGQATPADTIHPENLASSNNRDEGQAIE